ncbi:hypothetical protein, partial [Streptococcus ruminantium]|uniref:hypothetical protein n=1 Tax=Streptococcus ruminantium TaxID=1917441 RepID=UPI00280E3A6E
MFSTGVLSSSLIVRTSNKNHLIKLPPVSMLFFCHCSYFFLFFSYQILSDDAFRVATYYSQLSGKPLSSDLFTAIERARYM